MNVGGLSRRIVNVAMAAVGHVRGGLGYVTVVAACVLAALSGSAIADAAALATLLVPMMVQAGHDRTRAAGLVAAAGIIGPIIPPSIGFVIFGVAANLSITKLFLAGIMPTTYFSGRTLESIKLPSTTTRTANQRTILELVGYRYCYAAAQQALEGKARRIAMLSTQPLYILRESLQHLPNERVVAPRYTTLQDMVGRVVTHEGNRVATLLERSRAPAVEKALDALLQADEQNAGQPNFSTGTW